MSQSLNRLVIDTATNYLYVALYKDNQCVESIYQIGNQDHSVTLMPTLEDLLSSHTLTPKAIDEIYVGVGPGSYTGIRIGVVVAKMLGWSLNVAVYEVSSLALMASSIDKEAIVLPFIDARRGYVFTGLYQLENGLLKRIKEDLYTHFETFKSHVHYDLVIDFGKPDMTKLFDSTLVKKVDNIHHLSPVYLRETEAERQLKSKHE